MRVLVLTAMYPSASRPVSGTFVQEQVESLRAAGVDVEVMDFDGARSLRNYLRAGQALRRKLRESGFDIVHAHYGLTALPALMQRQVPVVVTYHGSDILGQVGPAGNYTFAGRLKVLLSKTMGRFVADRIIVAELLRNRWWDAHVLPMGVDLEKFAPRPQADARRELGLDPVRRYVLFLANPANRGKRHDIASAAVDLVRAGSPDVELLTVFKVPHTQVPAYMSAADVLVLTSDHEASPCVIKEALAANLPIVSVRCGDVEDRIRGVRNCRLCERTPADVAAKLEAALAEGGPTNGREAVASISLAAIARKTVEVYRGVLASR